MAQRTYVFIHQNMPAQFYHLCGHLSDRGEKVVFITRNKQNVMSKVYKGVYNLSREPTDDSHRYLIGTESGVLHGQAVYRYIATLLKKGLKPDIVIGHAGWGETLFVKDILPNTPLLTYFEYFYHRFGQDLNFDPEFKTDTDEQLSVRLRNNLNLLAGEATDWGISPTRWQFGTYPAHIQAKTSVIHEGIDTNALAPSSDAVFVTANGKELRPGQKVVTFVARNLEPTRGFHVFMRAIPEIQRRHPDAEILIIGKDRVGYGKQLPEGDSFKKRLLAEVSINQETVHFTGHQLTGPFRAAMQVSAAHVYLTYPFVLSWSMLEAMSSECLVIGSRTPPVEEVIVDGKNGLLVDFFDSKALADRVSEALAEPERFREIRKTARKTIKDLYDLRTVALPKQVALLDHLMTRSRSRR
jgi:glycosyltransferase involved in cell wall biosynthesis